MRRGKISYIGGFLMLSALAGCVPGIYIGVEMDFSNDEDEEYVEYYEEEEYEEDVVNVDLDELERPLRSEEIKKQPESVYELKPTGDKKKESKKGKRQNKTRKDYHSKRKNMER